MVKYKSKNKWGKQESRDPEGILHPVIGIAVFDTDKVGSVAALDDEGNLQSSVVDGDKVTVSTEYGPVHGVLIPCHEHINIRFLMGKLILS